MAIPLVIDGAKMLFSAIEVAIKVFQEPKQRAAIEQKLALEDAHFQQAYRLTYAKLQSDADFRNKMLQWVGQKEKHLQEMQIYSAELGLKGIEMSKL